MRVEILLFDGFDELDVFGPFEGLHTGGIEVALVAIGGPRRVTSGRGVEVGAGAPGAADGTVVPGGGWLDRADAGAWGEVQRGDVPALLRERADRGAFTASVCTGAFLLGAAGLLEGRDATTNSAALAELEPLAGRVLRQPVVDAWPVVTSMGPGTGLALGLAVVARLLGVDAATRHAAGLDAPGAQP